MCAYECLACADSVAQGLHAAKAHDRKSIPSQHDIHHQHGFRRTLFVQTGAQSAIDKIVTNGFREFQLIYFFTAGADEVKCWQIRKNSKAPQVTRTSWLQSHAKFSGLTCFTNQTFSQISTPDALHSGWVTTIHLSQYECSSVPAPGVLYQYRHTVMASLG